MHSNHTRLFILALASLNLGLAPRAHADLITYISATRTVTATVGPNNTFTDTTLAPFDHTASSTRADPCGTSESSTNSASLQSSLLADSITLFGASHAVDGISSCSGSGGGSASATATIRFSITQPLSYILSGPNLLFGTSTATSREKLTLIDSGAIIFNQPQNFPSTLPDLAGTLAPGTYELFLNELATTGGIGSSNAHATFSRTFSLSTSSSGSCCSGSGTCSITLVGDCGVGSSWTQGGICSTNTCPQPGRCCAASGSCTSTLASACAGSWSAGTCTPTICPPLGACCSGTACSLVGQAACTGTFKGAGVACGTTGNPVACCVANFNAVSGISIQDIFDFLSAWFAGDPRCDINHTNGVTIADIFDFLAIWFAGC